MRGGLKIDTTGRGVDTSDTMSSQDDCAISVNLTQVPTSTTPLHIVLWKGVEQPKNDDAIKRLLDRITVLESMVSGLLESQKASLWFPPCLRPTPTGIEVISRRDSMGGESDIGTVFSQIVRPQDVDVRTVNIVPNPLPNVLSSPLSASMGPEVTMDSDDELDGPDGDAEVDSQADARAQAKAEAEAEAEAELEAELEAQEAEMEAEGEPEGEAEAAGAEGAEGAEGAAEVESDEDIVEYKEIEWKGKTYYVDSGGEVYEMDSDGDLIERPIGVWRETTQKLVRYTNASV